MEFLTCLFLLMMSSYAQSQQLAWICSFNTSHSCSNGIRWIPMNENIGGMTDMTNGYVVADINNGSSTSEEMAILTVSENHKFLSNRGTINIWYRSETTEPREIEGTLNIRACKSQPEPVFSVGHMNCSNWCTALVNYTCANRSDVQIIFTATKGSEYTEIAIDYIYITPTPDWEFSSSDGYNESKIEQSNTDSSDWTRIGTGTEAFFQAVLSQDGDRAVFAVKHQFTASNGDVQMIYKFHDTSDSGFLNVSTCFDKDTVQSVPPSVGPSNLILQYDCGGADNVSITFTAVRGHGMTTIDIYTIRIFEEPSSAGVTLMSTADQPTTTITAISDHQGHSTHMLTEDVEVTTNKAAIAIENLDIDTSGGSLNRIVIPVVVAIMILLILVILVVVRCILRRRKPSRSNPNPLPTPRSHNVYTNPAFIQKPNTPNGEHQPDLLDGLNDASNVESREARNFQPELSANRSGSNTAGTPTQDAHRYYSIDDAPDDDEGDDPDSHDYSILDETLYDQPRADSQPDNSSQGATTDLASAGYTLLKKQYDDLPKGPTPLMKETKDSVRDSISNHDYYSLEDDPANDYALLVPPDCTDGNNGVYGHLGTTDTPVLYDDEDYNHLAHKDHHHIEVGPRRPGNQGYKQEKPSHSLSDNQSAELFNDNFYNTFNDGVAEGVDDGGNYQCLKKNNANQAKAGVSHPPKPSGLHKEDDITDDTSKNPPSQGIQASVDDYESVDFDQDGSDTQHPSLIGSGEDSLEDDYQEPFQPNITNKPNQNREDDDGGLNGKGNDLTIGQAGSMDVKDEVNTHDTVKPQIAGDYQSLKFRKKGKKNRKDDLDGVDQGLSNVGTQNLQDSDSPQRHLDRDLDAYGPKSDSFDRISPLYHSIKIGNK